MFKVIINGKEFNESGMYPCSPLLRSSPYHLSGDDAIQLAINQLIDICGTEKEKEIDGEILKSTITKRVFTNDTDSSINYGIEKIIEFLHMEWGLFRRGISQKKEITDYDANKILKGLELCFKNIYPNNPPTEHSCDLLYNYCYGSTPENTDWKDNKPLVMRDQLKLLIDPYKKEAFIPCIHGEEDQYTTKNLYNKNIGEETLLNGTEGLKVNEAVNTYTSCSIGASRWNKIKSLQDNSDRPFYLALIFGEGGVMTTGTVSKSMYVHDGVEVIFDKDIKCKILNKISIEWQKDFVNYNIKIVAVRTVN
ncbi:hypothetical protein EXT70_08740 [Dickeya dadantii]|nr:hypothetical protein [Dickeya dadantii]